MSGQDVEKQLLQPLNALATSPATELTIPPGIYRLPKEGLTLRKLKDKTIHAEGVTLVGTSLQSTALQLQQCVNVKLTGLTIDYDPLPFTQGHLTAVNAQTRTAEFEVSAGYPELSEAYLDGKNAHLFEKDAARWKAGTPDYYPKEVQRISAMSGRLVFSKNSAGFENLEVGDRLVLNVRKKQGVLIGEGCSGLTFEKVTVHSAPGIGILVRFAEEAGTFQDVRVVPGPKPKGATEERLFSTSADAFNAAYTRKGPTLNRCEFSHMGDDAVNLHGVMLPVIKWLDDRTFLSMRSHRSERFDRLIHPGDEVRFLKEPSYAITASGKVESITYSESNDASFVADARKIWPTLKETEAVAFFVIRLTQPAPGVSPGDFCDVPATSAPGFSIRECSFHDHRARGLRLMSNDGMVENNRFERLKGVAISIGPEYAFWREAGWCRNIVIRGNHIADVGQGSGLQQRTSYTTGAITVMGRVEPKGEQTSYFQGNENIEITANLLEGCSVNGITISAAKNVRVSRNALRKVNQKPSAEMAADYGLTEQKPISVQQADATLEANQIEP
ncbi:MAG TPA: right-handed parallel beta-helix repeat-containing protein [Candidatus Saccharimonadia bacterium]|nr:right-handed parallel beta-helix repeat-containing protein [Candidatus Saccharimonadia bacterium]